MAVAAPTRTEHRRRNESQDGRGPDSSGRSAAGLLAPFVFLYVLFIIGPALYGLLLSFFNTSLVKSGLSSFAGLGNYKEALTNSEFWDALWHTIWFTILTTPPLIVLGFVFALLADRVGRSRWFFRLAFFAPFVLPSAVVALIWIWLYTPGLGLIEAGLSWIGITAAQLARRPQLGDAVARDHDHLVDARLQLRALPRRACRTSRGTSTRPPPSTGPGRGSRSAGSPSRCWDAPPPWWRCCR